MIIVGFALITCGIIIVTVMRCFVEVDWGLMLFCQC